jgi:intracellular sulfur oxidation DsrE/DsrF family protein
MLRRGRARRCTCNPTEEIFMHKLQRTITLTLTAGLLVLGGLFAGVGFAYAGVDDEEKVVYHINDSANARPLFNNVRNHLVASPKTKIVVVGHGKGLDFMLKNATDAGGNPYIIGIELLTEKGVEFRACRNTLASRSLKDDAVEELVKVVPSGVAEIGRLQAKEGYVYLKP